MKKIKLTQGKFALVDDEGFEYLSQWKWYATTGRSQYAARTVNKTKLNPKHHTVFMHQQILGSKGGDHIDGDGLNNQRINLREASLSENARNRGPRKNNKLGLKGVYFDTTNKKFKASITHLGVKKALGYFKTPEEAHEAYKKAALELHGEFAKW